MKNILIIVFLLFIIISFFSDNDDSEITPVEDKTQEVESVQDLGILPLKDPSESIKIIPELEEKENDIIKNTETINLESIENVNNSCNPNYSGCLKINAGDYDCAGGAGDGPNYTGNVKVIAYDEFGLDRDNDGWGCE